MSADKNQHELEQDARRILNDSVETLSPDVQRRLQEARQAALLARPNQGLPFQNAWLGWGLAASLCLTVYLAANHLPGSEPVPQLASNSDLDAFILVASMDDTEFDIIEDLEFAYWISQQLEEDASESASHRG